MGAITSASIAHAGSGYLAGDAPILILQGTNHSAFLSVVTVDGGGGVLTATLPGTGYGIGAQVGSQYSVASALATEGGSGTGLTIDILTVGPGCDATHGAIDVNSISSGGSGYADGDTGYLAQGGNITAQLTVYTDGHGAVRVFNFDTGDGYAVGLVEMTNAGPQAGHGSGFTLDIQSIIPCGGSGSGYRNRFF